MSPGFAPRPSLSAYRAAEGRYLFRVSPGFAPRPSLSVVEDGHLAPLRTRVAGVRAPAFVERGAALPPRCAARASEPATGSSARRPRNAWERGPEPGRRQERGVWSIAALRGKTDPSRDGGRGRRAAGRDGRDGPRDSADVAPWQPVPSGDDRLPGSAACSRHGRDHTPHRWRTGGYSIGRSSGVTVGPRRRSPRSELRLDSAAPAVAQQRRPARSVGARDGHEGPTLSRALTPHA